MSKEEASFGLNISTDCKRNSREMKKLTAAHRNGDSIIFSSQYILLTLSISLAILRSALKLAFFDLDYLENGFLNIVHNVQSKPYPFALTELYNAPLY